MGSYSWLLCAFLVSLSLLNDAHLFCNADPTDGFTPMPLTNRNFDIQRPYNIPIEQRYSDIGGVRRMWVYSTDKPHFHGGTTRPRTELRIRGYDYTSGVWQFEGHAYVPSGTTGVSIMQVFGGKTGATTMMLWVRNGSLSYYGGQVIVDDIYDKWFRVNVIHDVGAGQIRVFIDGALKLTVKDHGAATHFFKCGVYEQRDSSHYMESRWQGIRVLRLSN